MTLLTATIEDVTPRGRLLPEGVYRVAVEEAGPQEKNGNSTLYRRYGNIVTREGQSEFTMPDGSTFRIGNRKLFKRSWIDHKGSAEATRIGQQEIKREAIVAGLMQKPEKGGPATELSFYNWPDYAEALVGREFLVRVKHKTRTNTAGEVVKDDAGEPVVDVEVVDWIAP